MLELRRREIPFATVSSHTSDQQPDVFAGAPLILKPRTVRFDMLLGELRRLRTTGAG